MDASTTTKLTCTRVFEIYISCRLRWSENVDGVRVEGGTHNAVFHPERLARHKAEIEEMLDELPDGFKKSGGGGWSFRNAYLDRHGNRWTDLHLRVDQLFMLGLAIGKVELIPPKKVWLALPSSMPYYAVN